MQFAWCNIAIAQPTYNGGNFKNVERSDVDTTSDYQTYGVKDNLPVYYHNLAERLTFPLSWTSHNHSNFWEWKKLARKKVMECLLYSPPSVPYSSVIISEKDRGSYIAQRVVLNISADSRVLGYMLIPKGQGPFPAVLLLHDHGGYFSIGKEKMVCPFDESPERMNSSKKWVDDNYGGRYIGDELAKRGYVCFTTDAINWSDRGGAGYEGQQALAGTMIHLGASFAGTIAYEDMRAAEFLAVQPNVDSARVAAIGLSMGAFRTWQVAALSPYVKAGIAICWMSTVKGIMVPGNNATQSQSAWSMTHPGLFNFLDYPDVASIACPKPMLFFNGLRDGLFPTPAVKAAYKKMHQVWSSQDADSNLVTKLWDERHLFNKKMQDEAFTWLDQLLK